ncbi:MAG: T9SS type A sorting domain-containing protein [Chitinophagales bacterium]|nr:T9SS type A sorting domain-containing protein [Chitinophagales bacterium]
MKRGFFITILSFFVYSTTFGQNVWTQLNDAPFSGRITSVAFGIDLNADGTNDKGYWGTGWDFDTAEYNDFWEYDVATDSWTQKANVPGPNRREAFGFSIDGKGYLGAGAVGFPGTFLGDFYEFDPIANTWTAKANLPGLPRWGAIGVAVNGKGYMGFGATGTVGTPFLSDFWEYDPILDTWSQKASCQGSGRVEAGAFAINLNGSPTDGRVYVSCGRNNSVRFKDLWEFNPTLNQWTQKSNYPGAERDVLAAFSVNGKGFIGLGRDASGFSSDMYEYDPIADNWLIMSSFPGTPRISPATFVVGDSVYILGGFDTAALSEMYRYVPFLRGYNTIRGNIFADANLNCQIDTNEYGLNQWIVQAIPGPYYGSTDTLGNYFVLVDTGTYSLSILPNTLQAQLTEVTCPANNVWQVHFDTTGVDTMGFNFALEVSPCSLLDVAITSSGRRRCFPNFDIITYCNHGFSAVANAEITLTLPEEVVLLNASAPYGYDVDSNIVFAVGDVLPGQCNDIQVTLEVSCDDPFDLGRTVCTEVRITPDNNCITPDSMWSGAHLQANISCLTADTALVTITNVGVGDMSDSTAYRIFLDQTQVFLGNVLLDSGASFTLFIPTNGATVRVEADQPDFDPQHFTDVAWLEGCGLDVPIPVSTGIVPLFVLGDEESNIDINCQTIIGSWDPNDKQVFPTGLTEDHFVKPGTTLNYLIRFQNTGTDTAFNIVVIDTVSEHIDPASIVVTGASHPYTLSVSGLGVPVLRFSFDNILLPDSNVNLLGSQGFISFNAIPYSNTALETQITNFADIYFDFNPPVRTNTVFNIISNYEDIDNSAQIVNGVLLYTTIQEAVSSSNVRVFPNPSTGQFFIAMDNAAEGDVEFILNDLSGRIVWQQKQQITKGNMLLPFDIKSLSSGMYLLNIRESNNFTTYKVLIE